MKKGDVVTVYEDPISQKKVEGKAKILKVHAKPHYYRVVFIDYGDIVDRFIYPKKS